MNKPRSAPSYKRHRFPPEIIAHAVWLSFRFARSYRDVEERLAERGVVLTHETVRQWCRKFGQTYANGLCRRPQRPGDKWYLDEVFIRINGATHYLWRAVDQDGSVLDILVRSRRDKAAATKFFRRRLKRLECVPRVVIADKLASDGAARRQVLPSIEHRQHKRRNNRAENSHQPTRTGAADAAVQESGACPALPRRLQPDFRPLPPSSPPPHRRRLPAVPRRALRLLAGGHRHPADGLSSCTCPPHHTSDLR
jgi:putative transposase